MNPRIDTGEPLTRRRFFHRAVAVGAGCLLGGTLGDLPAAGDSQAVTRLGRTPATTLHVPRTLREKVGQLFVVSFRGTSLDPHFATLLVKRHLGGVVLFARNCTSAGQVRTLLSDLQSVSPFPLLVCTDQEGGMVVRIRQGAPVFPSEAIYGQVGSAGKVYRDAAATAYALRSLGLNLNLAPVVDVLGNAHSPIGTRSYGSDPNLVARLTTAAIHGYQDHHVGATAKHFVGLGHTSTDSHQALPAVSLSLHDLERSDLLPFRSAIAAGVSSVLVAHVALPAIDSVYRPASLSPVVIEGILRRRLGFQGVVMTDSLLMGALPAGREPEAAERAFAAGADLLLLGWDRDIPPAMIEEAVDRVVRAVERGSIPERRVTDSVRRILALKRHFPVPLRRHASGLTGGTR